VQLQPGTSAVGYLSCTTTGLMMQWHHVIPLIECRVTGDKTMHAHTIEDIIYYS
jgi:hypothetical protein